MADRISVYVDGNNISVEHADAIANQASNHAHVVAKQVYGDITYLPRWQERADFLAIHSGTGKNAADILIAVDALEHALLDKTDAILIASSDSDFRHLAFRLRQHGLKVVGMGRATNNPAFQSACSEFIEIETTVACDNRPRPHPNLSKLDAQILEEIRSHTSGASGLLLSEINHLMRCKYQTRISSQPEKTWHRYLSQRPEIFSVDPRGKDARVRIVSGL